MINQSVSVAVMEKALGAMWQRGQLITHNITNEDTPGFKAKRLSFETELRKKMNAIENTNMNRGQALKSVDSVSTKILTDDSISGRADGNNVNLDSEHIELARVQMQHEALLNKISGHYTMLKFAVTGGR